MVGRGAGDGLLLLGLTAYADALSTPTWRLGTDAHVATAASLMLPPRRLEETVGDGRCLQHALLQQLRTCHAAAAKQIEVKCTEDEAISGVRREVVQFVLKHQDWQWGSEGYQTLGHLVAASAVSRGWCGPGASRSAIVRNWARRMLADKLAESDGAFIFAAAACFRARIHVHFTAEHGGLMQQMIFSAPPSSAWVPTRDMHIAFVRGGADFSAHCLSLPVATQRGDAMTALVTSVAAILTAKATLAAHVIAQL